jgi:hypothetical protein
MERTPKSLERAMSGKLMTALPIPEEGIALVDLPLFFRENFQDHARYPSYQLVREHALDGLWKTVRTGRCGARVVPRDEVPKVLVFYGFMEGDASARSTAKEKSVIRNREDLAAMVRRWLEGPDHHAGSEAAPSVPVDQRELAKTAA